MFRRNVIDLFSGCGGSALGFKKAGFEIRAAVDSDKNSGITYKKNNPNTFFFGEDIRNLSGNTILGKSGMKINECFAILACPPCQGFSSARRKNQRGTDSRNELIFEFVRLVKEIQPIAFVMENVPGLAKGIGKTLFEKTLERLKRAGYINLWHDILEVADFGVPERRKRLVVIGTKDRTVVLSKPSPTHRNPNKPENGLPIWKSVKEQIGDLPPIKAGKQYSDDPLHKAAGLSPLNFERMTFTPHDGGSRTSWPYHLWLKCHKKLREKLLTGYTDIYGRMKWGLPSPTITGGCAMISKGRYGHPEQNRAISLREAARLQTFPDSFIFEGNFGEIAKQIGNAVPPLFAQRIAESLLATINNSRKKNKSVNV